MTDPGNVRAAHILSSEGNKRAIVRYSKQWGVKLKENTVRTCKTKYKKDCGKGSRRSRCQSKHCQIENKDDHCCPSGHCMCKETEHKIWTHPKCQSTNREMLVLNEIAKSSFAKFFRVKFSSAKFSHALVEGLVQVDDLP